MTRCFSSCFQIFSVFRFIYLCSLPFLICFWSSVVGTVIGYYTFQPQNFAWFFFYNLYSAFWLFLKEHSCVYFEAQLCRVALRLHSWLSGQQPGSSAHTFQLRLLCSADGSVWRQGVDSVFRHFFNSCFCFLLSPFNFLCMYLLHQSWPGVCVWIAWPPLVFAMHV